MLVGAITACTKEREGLLPQEHDANVYQQIMHANMIQTIAMKMTGDDDHDFALMMQMHRQVAIDMAIRR